LRTEKFSRYTDKVYGEMCRELPLFEVLNETRHDLTRLTEVDMLVGDEPVIVATIHKTKGLEFERVIIPRCENGIYPRNDATPKERAEQARTLYVALTRTQRQLILLYSSLPSQFLTPVLENFIRRRDVYRKRFGLFSYFTRTSDWLVRYRKEKR